MISSQKPLLNSSSSALARLKESDCLLPNFRLIEAQVARRPDKIAVQFGDQCLSYGELNHRANRLARYFVAQGAGADVLIAVCLERSLEMLVTLLAILKAGSAYLPLDLAYPSDRIQYILEDAQAPLLITHGSPPPLLGSQTRLIDLASLDLSAYADHNLEAGPNSHDLAYVIYTSGSTGKPKGVQINHRSLSNLIQSMAQRPGLNAEDVSLAVTTICFDIAMLELFLPLSVGATMVMLSRDVAVDGLRLKQALEDSPITWAQATPSTWRMLLAAGWRGHKRLKLLCGGEAMTRDLADQLLECCGELWNVYGPTETTIWSMITQILPGDAAVSLGQPIAQTQVYLMECLPNGELYPVAPGESGEICIGGWGVARGYLNRPELNQKKFMPDFSSREPGARLYRTGDLARERSDGSLQFLGRVDHQVKIRGHRVELSEIEAVLLQHPEIHNAAVIAKTDASGSQQLVSYLVATQVVSPLEQAGGDAGLEQSIAGAELNSAAEGNVEVVEQWKALWDDAYRQATPEVDPTFDFSGYGDSYTGELLPAAVVEEWTEQTVERILALRPQRLLEVGCGKGLLLFRVAPQCDRYIGVDVTPAAISHLRQYLSHNPDQWSHVSLAEAAAHELDQLTLLEGERFDTIVINSVIQYFPDVDYLLYVFQQLVGLLAPGGRIFVGDVRNVDLLEVFHCSVQLYRHRKQRQADDHQESPDSLDAKALYQRIHQHSQQDSELLFSPRFFDSVQQLCPRISQVVTQLKRGHHRSELTDFRYDAVLHVETIAPSCQPPRVQLWTDAPFSLASIKTHLEQNQPQAWCIRGIPNARIDRSVRQLSCLKTQPSGTLVASLDLNDLPADGLEPENLWQLAEDLPYLVQLCWSQDHPEPSYDVLFLRVENEQTRLSWAHPGLAQFSEFRGDGARQDVTHAPDYHRDIHQPRSDRATPSLPHPLSRMELNQFLQQHLPTYMSPSQYHWIERLPLTPNGKVDRKALGTLDLASAQNDSDYIAPATDLEEQLITIWERLLNISPIGRNAHFFELGGHSLLATQLIGQIRKTFSVDLGLASLFQAPCLEQLASLIEQQCQDGRGAADATEQTEQAWLEADLVLDESIFPESGIAPASPELRQVLLTGATGFVGGFLLQELLSQTQARVYCLVRSPNQPEAQRKLENHLERCLIDWEDWRDRIIAIPGDLSHPNLGLPVEQHRFLAQELDAIYHNGAYVNLIYPYSALRATNVQSCVEVLRLACQDKLKPVHYISTLDVIYGKGGFSPQARQNPDQLPVITELSSDYARSKWVAEQLFQMARGRGIPCNIYRLGMTTGHSQTGFSNANDMMGRLLQGLVQLQSAPQENFSLNLSPVDHVCRAIVALAQQSNCPEITGQTFHIFNPHAIQLQELIRALQHQGYPLNLQAYPDWQADLLADAEDNALVPLFEASSDSIQIGQADFFQVMQLNHVRNHACSLASPTIAWPQADAQLMERYISYFISCGILPNLPSETTAKRNVERPNSLYRSKLHG